MTASPGHRIEMIDLDLEDQLHTAPKLFVCPACKKRRGVNIDYGMPGPDLIEQVERGEAVLGGCCHALKDPDRQCLDCGHQWQIVRRKASTTSMMLPTN